MMNIFVCKGSEMFTMTFPSNNYLDVLACQMAASLKQQCSEYPFEGTPTLGAGKILADSDLFGSDRYFAYGLESLAQFLYSMVVADAENQKPRIFKDKQSRELVVESLNAYLEWESKYYQLTKDKSGPEWDRGKFDHRSWRGGIDKFCALK